MWPFSRSKRGRRGNISRAEDGKYLPELDSREVARAEKTEDLYDRMMNIIRDQRNRIMELEDELGQDQAPGELGELGQLVQLLQAGGQRPALAPGPVAPGPLVPVQGPAPGPAQAPGPITTPRAQIMTMTDDKRLGFLKKFLGRDDAEKYVQMIRNASDKEVQEYLNNW